MATMDPFVAVARFDSVALPLLGGLKAHLEDLLALFTVASDSPSAVWKAITAADLVFLQEDADLLAGIQPVPRAMRPVAQRYGLMRSEIQTIVDHCGRGVNDMDEAEIRSVIQHAHKVMDLLTEANDYIDRLAADM